MQVIGTDEEPEHVRQLIAANAVLGELLPGHVACAQHINPLLQSFSCVWHWAYHRETCTFKSRLHSARLPAALAMAHTLAPELHLPVSP